eukprot:COSAG03_NODE_13520_length_497_cov_0.546135_2_plen_53_part_01
MSRPHSELFGGGARHCAGTGNTTVSLHEYCLKLPVFYETDPPSLPPSLPPPLA